MSRIYFIGIPAIRVVKIGMAADPRKRMATLQTAQPFELKLLFDFPGDARTEGRLHQRFEEDRIRGEWFNHSPAIAWHIFGLLPATTMGLSVDDFLDRTEPWRGIPEAPGEFGLTPDDFVRAWSYFEDLLRSGGGR